MIRLLNYCRFAKYCRYYQQNAHTCHDDKEAKAYCGARSEFDKYAKDNQAVKIKNMANLFVIRFRSADNNNNNNC